PQGEQESACALGVDAAHRGSGRSTRALEQGVGDETEQHHYRLHHGWRGRRPRVRRRRRPRPGTSSPPAASASADALRSRSPGWPSTTAGFRATGTSTLAARPAQLRARLVHADAPTTTYAVERRYEDDTEENHHRLRLRGSTRPGRLLGEQG